MTELIVMTTRQMADKTVNLNIRIREETRDKLKVKARQLGTTYSELINAWIEDFVGEGEESPSLFNDKEGSNDVKEQIETLREEMEEKLESLRRDYQYNDEQYSNDIKSQLSQLEGEMAKKGSAIESFQEQVAEAVTKNYCDQKLAQALEVVWEQLDYSEDKMMKNMEGIICDLSKIEPKTKEEESNDLEEVKQEENTLKGKIEGLTQYDLAEGLTQHDLAKRLGVTSSTVARRIKEKRNEEWSTEKDPEGVIWEFSDEDKLYYPKARS